MLSGPQRRGRDWEREQWGHEHVPEGSVGWTGQCWKGGLVGRLEKEVAIQGKYTCEKCLKQTCRGFKMQKKV